MPHLANLVNRSLVYRDRNRRWTKRHLHDNNLSSPLENSPTSDPGLVSSQTICKTYLRPHSLVSALRLSSSIALQSPSFHHRSAETLQRNYFRSRSGPEHDTG